MRTRYRSAFGVMLAVLLLATGRDISADELEAASRQYAVAAGFQNQKLYGTAIEEWRTFLERYPSDHRSRQAWHYLGTCHLQEQQFQSAIDAFRKALRGEQTFDRREDCLLNFGIACFGKSRAQKDARLAVEGATQLQQLLKLFPESSYTADALYYQGECWLQAEQPNKAKAVLTVMLQRFPDHQLAADARYALAAGSVLLGQPDQARQVYETFLRQHDGHPLQHEVQFQLAEVLFQDSKFDLAARHFETLSQRSEFLYAEDSMMRHARCLYELQEYELAGQRYWDVPRKFRQTKRYDMAVLAGSKCYLLAGQYKRARSGLQRLVSRDVSEAAEAARWLAQSYLDEGDPDEALRQATQALQKFGTSAQAPEIELVRLDALAQLHRKPEEVAAAYRHFATEFAEHDKAADALHLAATHFLTAADYSAVDSACAAFRQSYSDHDLRAEIEFLAGEALLQQKQFAKAGDAFQRLLDRFPEHSTAPRAGTRRALALHLQGRHTDVVRELRPIVDSLPDPLLQARACVLLGRSYLALSKPADAVSVLQPLLQTPSQRPMHPEALLVLAEARRAQKNSAQAQAALDRLLSEFSESEFVAEALCRMGDLAVDDNNYELARTRYAELVRRFPKSELAADGYLGLGWACLHSGRSAESQQHAAAVIETFPNTEAAQGALYLRSLAAYQLQQFDAAVRDADRYLQSPGVKSGDSRSMDALYVKGLAWAGLSRHQQAVDTWQAILQSKVDYAERDKVLYETAWSLSELNRVSESAAAFERLVREYPQSRLAAESQFRVGEVYYEAGRYADAAAAYAECADSGRDDIQEKALHKAGWSFLKQDQFSDAQKTFEEQVSVFPNGPLASEAQFLVAECLYNQQHHERALPLFVKTAESGAGQHSALAKYRAGECAAMLEDWLLSQKWYEAVLQSHPDFALSSEARCGIAWAYQNQQQYDRAVELYELVTQETTSETAAKARFMIGECCFAQKQHAQAARHFLKVTFLYDHDRWTPLALFEAGRCFEVMRDAEQARSCYEKLMLQYPGHDKVPAARERVAALTGT